MLDLLMNRRSIRKYKDQQVEKEKIDMILKGALTSPSAKNKKPWEVIVVTDKEKLLKLGDSRGVASRPISNANTAIVVLADPTISDTWIEDTSIISTIIQLTAHSLGLGSCWIQVRQRVDENERSIGLTVKEILNIPNQYEVEAIISIGYPDEDKKPHNEETLSYNKVHYNEL